MELVYVSASLLNMKCLPTIAVYHLKSLRWLDIFSVCVEIFMSFLDRISNDAVVVLHRKLLHMI